MPDPRIDPQRLERAAVALEAVCAEGEATVGACRQQQAVGSGAILVGNHRGGGGGNRAAQLPECDGIDQGQICGEDQQRRGAARKRLGAREFERRIEAAVAIFLERLCTSRPRQSERLGVGADDDATR